MNNAIPFWKYEATGNDFVLLDAKHCSKLQASDYGNLCDRRGGIGADQVLILHPDDTCDVSLEIRNADGEPAEMCGNGLRAIGRHLQMLGKPGPWKVQTANTIVDIETDGENFRADLGQATDARIEENQSGSGDVLHYRSLGNPHAVTRVADVLAIELHQSGPVIQYQECFYPQQANVHFVELQTTGMLKAHSWERGTGATLACGSGAAAIASVALDEGWVAGPEVRIRFPGGTLAVTRSESNTMLVSGPARLVFSGQIDPQDAEEADRSLRDVGL